MTSSDGTFRSKVHDMLRSSILDAAWQRACETPWSQVRLADVAADVGVSRQTIYNEFGSKERLVEAMFERELDRFFQRIVEVSSRAPSLPEALHASLTWMLEETAAHPLLRRLVRDARSSSSEPLLPVLTVRADAILLPMRTNLVAFVSERWPETDRAQVELICDIYVRFVLSLIIMPTDLDRGAMVDLMVSMAVHADG